MPEPGRIPLTAIERLFHDMHDRGDGLLISAGAACYPVAIDPARFRAAVAALCRTHPALRAVIRPDAGGEPGWEFPEPPPEVPVAFVEDDDPLAWERYVFADFKRPFDSAHLPLIRYTVFQPRSRERSVVVATHHHALFDGRTNLQVMRDLEAVYADPAAPRAEVPWPRGSRIHKVPVGKLRAIGGLARLFAGLVRDRFSPPASVPRLGETAGLQSRVVVSADDTAALIQRSREEKSSVYAALCAATLQATAERYDLGNRRLSLRSPTDLRPRHTPAIPPDALGCYVDTVRTVYRAPLRVPFWELARRVRAGVLERLNGNEAYFKNRFLTRFRPDPLKPRRWDGGTVVVTNLGVIESPMGMNEYWCVLNNHSRAGGIFVIAATVAGRLNIAIRGDGQTPEALEEFSAAFRDRLLKAVTA
jgi:hypothetical protein